MKIIKFYTGAHLGDNLATVLFLRKLSFAYPDLEFHQYVEPHYFEQVREFVEGTDRVSVYLASECVGTVINAWIAIDGFAWCKYQNPEYINFYIEWYDRLAKKAGLESPIKSAADMLYDFPSIQKPTPLSQPINFLIVNSAPLSGNFLRYNAEYFESLITRLVNNGQKVAYTQKCHAPPSALCTIEHGLTVAGIGNMSLDCDYIVAVATAPIYPTINVWNQSRVRRRFHMSDIADLTYGPTYQDVRTNEELDRELTKLGLL